LNRRFSHGLQFGLAYTYSKYMDYTGIPVYADLKTWAYGLDSSDQTHNLSVNFSYDTPKLSHLLPNPVIHHVFDGWVLSGIAQFVSGTPGAISFTTTSGADLTGGGDGQRVNVVGSATSTPSTFNQWFNTAAFAAPGKNDRGNAGKYDIRNPGVNNFDLSLTKRIPLKSDKRSLMFRWEAYNAFNHTQYSGLNLAAKFDSNTGAQINPLFGQVTSTRTPRVMQGALRIVF
jgi:hypothetical protein